jgi:hypothetical protein
VPELAAASEKPPGSSRLPWLPRVLFESLLIILSVVLALFLDDWREDRERAERVAQARGHFVREVCANRTRLVSDEYLPYHRRVREVWRALGRLPNPTDADLREANQAVYTGFHLITFREAVWRSVSESALMEHMPPEEVFLLSDVYRQQELIDTMNTSMMNAWRQPTDASLKDSITATNGWLGDVYYAELKLLKLYDQALKELDAKGCPAPASGST